MLHTIHYDYKFHILTKSDDSFFSGIGNTYHTDLSMVLLSKGAVTEACAQTSQELTSLISDIVTLAREMPNLWGT